MANWVHCNKCFKDIEKNKDLKFYLTGCGHLVCGKCAEPITNSEECVICNKQTLLMPISKEMDPSFKMLFAQFNSHLKRICEVSEFQEFHKESLLMHFKTKYEYAKEQCMKQYMNVTRLHNENKMLRAMIRQKPSTEQNRPIMSTPLYPGEPTMQNISMSTLSSNRKHPLGMTMKSEGSSFVKVPGMAHRFSSSKYSNDQSFANSSISTPQVVPNEMQGFVPIHRKSTTLMTSMRDLNLSKKGIRRF